MRVLLLNISALKTQRKIKFYTMHQITGKPKKAQSDGQKETILKLFDSQSRPGGYEGRKELDMKFILTLANKKGESLEQIEFDPKNADSLCYAVGYIMQWASAFSIIKKIEQEQDD